jgi:hypothetical protein
MNGDSVNFIRIVNYSRYNYAGLCPLSEVYFLILLKSNANKYSLNIMFKNLNTHILVKENLKNLDAINLFVFEGYFIFQLHAIIKQI